MSVSGTRYRDREFAGVPKTLYRQLCDHNFSATAIAKKLKDTYDAAEAKGDEKMMLKILAEIRAWFKFLAKFTDGDASFCASFESKHDPSANRNPLRDLTPEDYERVRREYIES